MKLNEFLLINKEKIDIDDKKTYKIAGVQSFGKGIVIRRSEIGKDLTMKKYQVIEENQLMWCKVDNKNGAFGITKKEHVGALASTNMTLGRIDTNKVNPAFLELLFSIKFFYEFINDLCTGATNRKYLKVPDLIEKVKIPNLSLEEQNIFLENYDKFKFNFDKLDLSIDQNQNYIKLLKQSILQEAIEGKLTKSWREENNDVEPASVLLEKIKAEKEELIKQKKLKKQKELAHISEDDTIFDIPKSWSFCKLGNTCINIHYGFNASAEAKIRDVRLVRITDIQNDKVNWDNVPGCLINDNQIDSYLLNNDDILIARTGGTIGKSYLVKNISVNAVFASYLIRLIPSSFINANYLKVYLGSNFYWEQLYKNSGGAAQPNVNGTALNNLLFTLPPLEEQKEIVKRVDELMKLCDELEKQTLETKENSENLMKAVLGKVFNK